MITKEELACLRLLTFLAAHHKVLEEVGGDALFRRQDRTNVDRQKLEHLALATELGGEGGGGDALLTGFDSLMFHN